MHKFSVALIACFLLVCACQPAQETVTTVFLVRHAEKDTVNTEDPPLTEKGKRRAAKLWQNLAADTVHALYSTDYKRTRATLEPISAQFNLPIQLYEAHDFEGLVNELQEKHAGQTIVVSGHSNTLLPTIEALGATPPIDSIGEQAYDHIFTVKIEGGKAKAEVKEYQPLR